ncbi:threonine synthase [Psittacicella melopsittaci]|uniref:Threonine synthase n=1 Tax=Psittacicella melopsittaci TaxID=2028576 RepID=A0A3A1Y5U6_9GAMM|nr:threonine synthase [Psittacicella melopsittaci]RIY33622.1 threonine synthase [Psittacicella melopsittaci]
MQLYNIKHPEEKVSFKQAVLQGLGKDQGLFFPSEIPSFSPEQIQELLALPFQERAAKVLGAFIGDEFSPEQVQELVNNAFNFPVPVVEVEPGVYTLELFHGPTLAFKDFGGRFMSQVLRLLAQERKITILTATSGDTGAAVAHAFYQVPNIEVIVLYPKGRISELQEKLFCTLGDNIKTIAINGDFDACQALVKQAFDDEHLREVIGLNSANSINISRLLAQITYYFEAYARVPQNKEVVISVPSGNFGNLTAGLLAKALGLPVAKYIAATNANDTVPRYLASGKWEPHQTQATLSNAMDVSRPNNWPRIEELFRVKNWKFEQDLFSAPVSDAQTAQTIVALDGLGYVSEPHGAVAYRVLKDYLKDEQVGIFLGTAHPAKFKGEVENILGREIALPEQLAKYKDRPLLSENFDADYATLKEFLLSHTAAAKAHK